MEECKSKSSEARQGLIYQHIYTLQRLTEFHGAKIVMCAESNLGGEAQHYGNYLRAHSRSIPNLIIMKEDKDMDGWRTTNTTKKYGYLRTNEILNERRIKFYEKIHTVQGSPISNMTLKERLVHQLRAFCRIVVPAKNSSGDPNAPNKEFFSGKMAGEDDLAVVLQMSLIIYERYRMKIDEYEGRSARYI